MTPYQFAGNKPIWSRKLEGLQSEVDKKEVEKDDKGVPYATTGHYPGQTMGAPNHYEKDRMVI